MDAGRAPVNIVFWGEERRSRTSAHMLAVAGMLSAMHRSAEVMPGVQKKRRRAEFYLYDMGAGLDSRKRHILWRADLVVVNLRQEEAQVKRFFLEHAHIARNVLLLLGGYQEEARVNCRYLERMYRVEPDRTAGIPHSNAFCRALVMQKSGEFIQREYKNPTSFQNEVFIRALWESTALLLKVAETGQVGGEVKQIKK